MFFKGGIIFNLKREKDKQTIKKARFLVFRNSRKEGNLAIFSSFKRGKWSGYFISDLQNKIVF